MSLLLEPSLVSRGRAALVSATAAVAEEDDSVNGGAEVKAGGDSSSGVSPGLLACSAVALAGK